MIDLVGLHEVARKRAGQFSLGMGQRLGIAAALLGDPSTVMLDEPVNGLDPEGVHWIRNLLKQLASRGPDGVRLLASDERDGADRRPPDRDRPRPPDRRRERARSSCARRPGAKVRVRTPQATRLRELVLGPHVSVTSSEAGTSSRSRASTPTGSGELAAANGIVLHELVPVQASLEEAFMELTRDDVEYKSLGIETAGARRGAGGMTTTAISIPRLREPGHVTQGRAVFAEWTKFISLRSTRWSLGVGVLLTIAFPMIFAAVTASHWAHMSLHDRAGRHPLDIALAGVNVAQLAIAVLGVLVITGEYSTGMIRSIADRGAEAAAGAVVEARRLRGRVVRADAAGGVDRLLRQPGDPEHGHHILQISFGAPGVARSVIGGAVYVMLVGVFALAIGAILRNTAGGIATFAGIFFVIPPLMNILPTSWNNAISSGCRARPAGSCSRSTRARTLLAAGGRAALAGYCAAAVAIAAVLLVRRDA